MATPSFQIDELSPWIEFRFNRASGPGGQNVNKLNTRVTLLFDYRACSLLTSVQRGRIARRLATRHAADGRLRVVAQAERTQAANRRLAEQRLLELLTEALQVRKKRIPTRASAASRRRRLENKRQRGELKKQRQKRPSLD